MPITLAAGEERALNVSLSPIPPEPAKLYGYVTDADTGAPIVATVQLSGPYTYIASSNVNGYYEINDIVPGSYDGLVTAEGYYDYPF